MRKLRLFLLILALAIFLVGIALFLIGYFRPKGSGLVIDSRPVSAVYVNGQLVGKTPYETTRDAGEVVVRLVPEDPELLANNFETKVKLNPGIKTIVKRDFGSTDSESQGEIVSFERVGGSEASLAIITIPDAAQITIDGKVSGFSPYKINSISPGEHQVIVASDGYQERVFTVRTYEKYKLTAIVQLAKIAQVEVPTESVPEEIKTFIEVGETPAGFLRVRETPATNSAELFRVNTGDKLPYVSEDAQAGWYQVEYESGKTGWISGQYSQKIEE